MEVWFLLDVYFTFLVRAELPNSASLLWRCKEIIWGHGLEVQDSVHEPVPAKVLLHPPHYQFNKNPLFIF